MQSIITVPMKWADVPGFEGFYQISNKGLVKSLARIVEYSGKCSRWHEEIILKLNNSNGYRTVSLVKDKNKTTFLVHILVGSLFIPNPENKPYINHKDGMRWNNHFLNLEWSTNSENQLHSYKMLGNKAVNGERNGQSKLKREDIITLRMMADSGYTEKEIASHFNVSKSLVGLIKNNKRWNHVT